MATGCLFENTALSACPVRRNRPMHNVEFAEMNAFVTIAERGSFAKAAVQLGMSRSRLSEVIRNLEEKLGVRLLNRTTRSVAPTEVGQRLLLKLRPVLASFAEVV